jgi:hypothetical protein
MPIVSTSAGSEVSPHPNESSSASRQRHFPTIACPLPCAKFDQLVFVDSTFLGLRTSAITFLAGISTKL